MIENLKKHLLSEGKTDTWLNLAVQFNILPNASNKQRSDKVRRVFNKLSFEIKDAPDYMQTKEYLDKKAGEALQTGRINLSEYKNIVFGETVFHGINYTTDDCSTTFGSVGDCIIDNPHQSNTDFQNQKNKEWNEFRKWKESKNIVTVKKTNGIHIVLPDIHVPYHNKELLIKLGSFIQDNKHQIVGFHIIGDYLDLKSLSSHDDKTIDKSGWTLGKEYEAGNLILDMFDSILPKNIQKTFLYGNHEDRYFRYVSNIKNYKTADAIQSPTQALKLKERGYEVFENWKEDYIQVGKYQLIHGNYCGTNPSKQHMDKLRSSVIFGHSHRVNQYFEGNLHALNIGCLADIHSDGFFYLSRVERQHWVNGFAIVNVHNNHSQAELIVCTNNSFFYAGKKY